MSSVKPKILEHDVVSLDVPMEAFPAGTIGTVVLVHSDEWVLVEVSDERGETIDELFEARSDQLTIVS
ncbi:DUF4926 domain-containing protein [Conexibacter woesei]|uniref:DUF4926 domain-containing protein n=1 Tax=Conexibacter woesei (strain DSM 14684 / CCUG 47730 / CIP 108061 / JCM 11494 / NBRC 100937 / ID131577) TaxID=469383 RepID=D3F620_CONWI|nr:DUF4926 domain-containing protein [Conexibacter woesei]ADB48693.1 hypothetical protein Cwoe_0257 [Conexibacter woesei DSM 14684]